MTTEEKSQEKQKNSKTAQVQSGSAAGAIWCIGWMFTIAFAKLIWWKALLGLIIWPYYLGLAAR